MVRYVRLTGAVLLILVCAGCGYTARSIMPSGSSDIYVENFENKIDVSGETSDARMYRGYRHGLENEITRAIIDRFIFDGNLKIATRENAGYVLTGALVDFRKEGLRYDANERVEEYRVKLIVDFRLIDPQKDTVIWREKYFSGESTYRTSGSLAESEETAVSNAAQDLARRVVERVIEGW